ncbi:MMPL family transporter [Lolliginicoccus suaedae]|uniref:MMPL family transporter n=1 Tax=Lolliginicoccus suaedae TaxID=2605429 RepID=UPI0011ED5D7A|nr:MMPL family transporter [Lolliginicoccus suaedae]
MLARWGSILVRRRWLIAITTTIAVLAGGIWGIGVFAKLSQGGYEPDGSESVRVAMMLGQTNLVDHADLVLVYTTPSPRGINDPRLARRINDTLDALPAENVRGVASYWSVQREQQQALTAMMRAQVTGQPQPVDPAEREAAADALAAFSDADQQSGAATIKLTGDSVEELFENYAAIRDDLPVEGAELSVGGMVAMGEAMNARAQKDLAIAEGIAIPLTLILLVIVFGGLAAASLPVLTGGLAILGSMGILRVISFSTEISAFALNMSILLGLGMAIDYSLFLVSRFREEISRGRDIPTAVRATVATAGTTVLFSGSLLILALAGMLLFPQPFIRSLALGGMASVAIAMLLALTVIPAAMAILGTRIASHRLRRTTNHGASASYERLARWVMRRPRTIAAPILIVLIIASIPALAIDFGEFSARSLPQNEPSRIATEMLVEEFPTLTASNAYVLVRSTSASEPPPADQTDRVAESLGQLDSIATIRSPGSQDNYTVLVASLAEPPGSEAAQQAIREIRGITPPNGVEILVGGSDAQAADSVDATRATLPIMLLVIAGAALVILFLAFGSLALPVKAVLMSLLSLGASLGIVVTIFQFGYGADLLGVTPAPLDVGVTVIIIAVLFGLSTDYEVFLVSRIAEARRRGASTEDAIATGVAHTGRIITTAALLLILVIGAFGISSIPMMRILAVGMVTALVLDATVIRLLLVPAIMKLMGESSWWLPRPARAIHQRFAITDH